MKGYWKFIVAICVLLAIYMIAEMNRPKPIDWTLTLSKDDKNPYGSYILYDLLTGLFPGSELVSTRLPIYNTLAGQQHFPSAYVLIDPELNISKEERKALLNYVSAGNYVFLSTLDAGYLLNDTLKISTQRRFDVPKADSVTINLINPALRSATNHGFKPLTLDTYFTQVDTSRSLSLGENQLGDVNFISMSIGKGKLFVHALPLCFTNSFLLTGENASYASKVFSYLPKRLGKIYWDEYYKLGREGSANPLRFVLNNIWLRWAFRVALLAVLTLLFFEGKRRQRIIPIIKPLRNSTLDFVRTVGTVYYEHRNNKNVAIKKINYFTDFIRSRFYLQANVLNDEFVAAFSAKSGTEESEVRSLVALIGKIHARPLIDDDTLLELNKRIDIYYEKFG